MGRETRPDFENLEVYRLAENLANQIWQLVKHWDLFSKETIGKQIVRSADSICANIAEGRGRYYFKDHQRYIRIARGSLYETVSWLRLAYARHLLTQEQSSQLKPVLDQLLPKLNAYLKSLER
ncbi:four helix bundle protein [Thermocoleostomius sinensis]|uniref:Four helix bundle protein n=1 Tax=Thermocoleostomius sinensis A174 TaxID=2016057 RepID=A0A9E8ZP35_9CYAN|nr:four helix bundle protein [Thermocoleostomius sinensis]WAL62171.1 four helix bundle protein [Thermocoleostomius sinensis A174]